MVDGPTDDLKSSPMGGTRRNDFGARLYRFYEWLTVPFAIYVLLSSDKIQPEYGMTRWKRMRLGWRMYRNTKTIFTGMSYRAHMAMATKLLEIPSSAEGVVVECGCFRGGTTANLSLICDIVGRDLYVYDSFEGLPEAVEGDKYASPDGAGFLTAQIDQVREHVRRHGVVDRCHFVKGWFSATLPHHDEPIALAFLDVDYQSSLHDCMINLWPKLIGPGVMFIDEYVLVDYCALFYSEKYWRKYFDTTPPGLVGAGSGIPLGNMWLGPHGNRGLAGGPRSVAYTRKWSSGHWTFYPDEVADESG